MKAIIFSLLVLSSILVSGAEYPTSEVKALLETDNREPFVHVGKDTVKQFAKRRGVAGNCTIKFISGYVPAPIGDAKASLVSLIECPGFRLMGLRLRKDMELSKYHILGYWTDETLSNQTLNQTTNLVVIVFETKTTPTGMLLVS